MGRLIKWLMWLAFIGALLLGGSYLAAWFRVGRFLGPTPPEMGTRHIAFLSRANDLPNRPLAWVVTYQPTAIPGARTVRFYVAPNGKILATVPRDLAKRLEVIERNRLP